MNMPDVRLVGIAPELALVVAAFVILIAGAAPPYRLIRPYLSYLATAGLVVAFLLSLVAWNQAGDGGPQLHLGGMVAVDGFAAFA